MKKILLIGVVLSLFTGCASFRPPPADALKKLPVVRVGDVPPANTAYVIFYPAGFRFPVRLVAKGSLFAEEKHAETFVVLSRDLYLYKYWASHDRVTWRRSHALLDVAFSGGLDIGGVHVIMQLNAKAR